MAEAKNFLYAFCGKRKVKPTYNNTNTTDGRFQAQLTIPGFEYTAKGFAQNKKDAETEAAKDFCGYLIGAGLVPPESLPDSVFAEEMSTPVPPLAAAGAPAPVQQQRRPPQIQQQPVGQPSQGLNQQSNFGGPSSLMNAPRPPPNFQSGEKYHYSMYNKRQFEEAEEVDLNAHLHGNWTVANAKSRLHQYLQQNRCSADFKYTTGGPDHNRHFSCELSVFVRTHKRTIKSKELASTKKQAAQKVALSLVRQLFHLGAIEGAEPGQLGAKKLKSDELDPIDVSINPELEGQVINLLNDLSIEPVPENIIIMDTILSSIISQWKQCFSSR